MRANSPSAFFASLTLHLVVAAILFLLALLLTRQAPPPPVIFELVAGEPTDAPERGPAAPEDLKVTVPKVKLPPEPVRESKVEPPPVEKPVPKEIVKKAPPKAEPKVTPKRETMSYEEFRKKNPVQKTTAPAPPRVVRAPQVDTAKITGSRAVSGERGKASTATDVRDQRTYEARLVAMLREAHEVTKPAGLGDTVSADAIFFLTADGQIRNVEIVRSSGNAEFDQSVLAAFRRMTWPGPRPDKRSDTLRVTFRMREL